MLVDDAGEAGGPFAGSLTLGSTGTIENSQCRVGLASATGNGTVLSLVLNVTFKPAFGGNRIEFVAAGDQSGHNTDWQPSGVWQVPFTPTVAITAASVSPGHVAAAVGTPQVVTFTVTDTKGAGDFGVVNVLTNHFLDGRQACYIAYVASSNTLLLVNDLGLAGGPFAGSMVLNGGSGSIQNSQCSISAAGSSVTTNGNTLTMTLNMTFSSAFIGTRVFYLAARDGSDGNNTGWQSMGTLTVQ